METAATENTEAAEISKRCVKDWVLSSDTVHDDLRLDMNQACLSAQFERR